MDLYFYEDIISPYTGEILHLRGDKVTENIVTNLLEEDVWCFPVTPVKPKNEESPYPPQPNFVLVDEDLIDLD